MGECKELLKWTSPGNALSCIPEPKETLGVFRLLKFKFKQLACNYSPTFARNSGENLSDKYMLYWAL